MSRMECPWCGKWRCKHCGRVRYYTGRDEEVVRCARCGRTDGELEGVVHTNQYIADEHLYMAQVERGNQEPKKQESTVDREVFDGVMRTFRNGMITADEAALNLGLKIREPDPEPDEDTARLDNAITEAICDVEWTPLSTRYAMARAIRERLGLKVKQWIDMPSDFPFADCVITHGRDGVEVTDEFGRDVTEEYRAWTAEQEVTYKVEGEL